MSYSAIFNSLRQRKEGEKRAQELVTSRLREIDRQRREAQAALDAATSHLSLLDSDKLHVSKQKQVIDRALRDAERELLHHYVSTLPDICYQLIFEAVIDLLEEPSEVEASGLFNFSMERALAPILLGLVCRRWRHITLATPRLWDRIDIPRSPIPDEDIAQEHLDRINMLLERTKSLPFDVLMPFVEWNAVRHPIAITMLRAVAEHTDRWRRVDISLPAESDHSLMSIFMNRTPHLTCLRLSAPKGSASEWRGDLLSGLLPVAPRLQSITLHRTGMAPSDHHPGYPSLKYIYIVNETVHTINTLLARASAVVETVRINVSRKFKTDVAIVLPRLEHLILLHCQYFYAAPVAPRLRRLTLRDPVITSDLGPVLDQLPVLDELRLCGEITVSHVPVLARASQVQEVRFTFPYTVMTDCDVNYRVDDAFFAAVADAEGCPSTVWPKLQRIILEGVGQLSNPESGNLLRLITDRNLKKRNVGHDAPSKIEEVVLLCDNAPRWLKDEISRVLALG
ncbi:hypothetical protein BKA62DRAFT_196555 [Auriculariales sp. MPI-PUGE-AT-0066]|nr:hypothetical protein BKA62DRAFT_196555 [Auriculariales sp. MPI-PUGE-AT-0066]